MVVDRKGIWGTAEPFSEEYNAATEALRMREYPHMSQGQSKTVSPHFLSSEYIMLITRSSWFLHRVLS